MLASMFYFKCTGCGKTSLLNILASRVPANDANSVKCTGSVYLNGSLRNEDRFRRISAYVVQDDHLYPHLTVYETFLLAANFFLSDTISAAKRLELVDAVISELGLNKARDTIIGDEKLRGVSGGERRRASIGVQLISDPAILFLDEPTSGLDAFQALSVMESMRTLSDNGRLVVCVIHQPRSSIFNMFDKLLLLSEGRCAYFGGCLASVDYFAALEYICPESFNPSDYFLDILSPDNRSPEAEEESRNRIQFLTDNWTKTLAADSSTTESKPEIEGEHHSSRSNLAATVSNIDDIKIVGSTSFTIERRLRNIKFLAWRTWTEQSRDVATIGFKMTFSIVFSLIIGGIYSNIGDSQRSIQNRYGLLFFVVINQLFPAVISVFNSFPKEATIVNRERASKAYDTLSYFVSKVLIEIPINIIPSLTYSCIIYWLVGLNTDTNPSRFFLFILIMMYTVVTGVAIGLAVSAGTGSVDAALGIGMPLLITSILFGGYYITISSLPIVLNWFTYISIARWAFEALCINEFDGLTFTCGNVSPANCIKTGQQALATLGFDSHTVSYPIFGLSMLLIGFLLLGYFFLSRQKSTFLTLGHVGKKFKSYHGVSSSNEGDKVDTSVIVGPSAPLS